MTKIWKGSICTIEKYNGNQCGKAVTKDIPFFSQTIQPVISGYPLTRKIAGILFGWNIQVRNKSMFCKEGRVTILELVQIVGGICGEYGISNSVLACLLRIL